uniref:C2H2-type domain-containing protein n=1 Tax=Poecilia latipinna TaxID=48699 RepID=A0A3B3VQX9_9TELE
RFRCFVFVFVLTEDFSSSAPLIFLLSNLCISILKSASYAFYRVEKDHSDPEPKSNIVVSQIMTETENQDREESNPEDEESSGNEEKIKQLNENSTTLVIHRVEKPFSCKTCQKVFSKISKLACHMRSHTDERPFSCDTCGKTFAYKSTLNKHVKTHAPRTPHMCNICGKTFIQKNALTCHVRFHTGEKPYLCNTCQKVFSKISKLACHMSSHTDERPFSCDTCGKTFAYKSTLNKHNFVICFVFSTFQSVVSDTHVVVLLEVSLCLHCCHMHARCERLPESRLNTAM